MKDNVIENGLGSPEGLGSREEGLGKKNPSTLISQPSSEEAEGLSPSSLNSQPSTLTAADLPPAVRAFWDSAPTPIKVPAILTAIDCYCALATRLRFKYTYDLDPHALLLQVLVVAEVCE